MNRTLNIFTLCLAFIIAFSVTQVADANAATATKKISGTTANSILGKEITVQTTTMKIPLTETQALHKKGYLTAIGVSLARVTTLSASVSLTSGADAVFAQLSTSLGITGTLNFTTGSSISYTIASDTASGRYRIEYAYPRVKVTQQKIQRTSSTEKVIWSRIIAYAPQINKAYRQLNRYANP